MRVGRRIGPLTLILLLIALGRPEAAELSYAGSSTLGDTVIPVAARAFTAKTGVIVSKIETQGSGRGLEMVLAGERDLGGVSRALDPAEKRMRIRYHIIGYDAMVILVHPDNRVARLTRRQLKAIFTGRAKNWREVGGIDAPIVPITGTSEGGRGINVVFRQHVMDGLEYAGHRWEIDRQEDGVTAVAGTPNGIMVASLAYARAGVKTVAIEGFAPEPAQVRSGAYLLSRPLLLAARSDARPEARRFLDFMLSTEGQEIVGRTFVPVR